MPTPERQKVHYTISEKFLPEKIDAAHFGAFYVARAESSVWFVASNGSLVSLTDLLLHGNVAGVPRHGRDGVDGAKGERGERGFRGDVGPQGPRGHDADVRRIEDVEKQGHETISALNALTERVTALEGIPAPVPGRDGQSIRGPRGDRGDIGPQGPKGRDADQTAVNACLTALQEAKNAVQSLTAQVSELKALTQGVLDMQKGTGEYIEWLKQRIAARQKKV